MTNFQKMITSRGRLTKRKTTFEFSGLGMKNNRPRKQQARSTNNFSAQTQFALWGTTRMLEKI
jgi:hypothetical protein